MGSAEKLPSHCARLAPLTGTFRHNFTLETRGSSGIVHPAPFFKAIFTLKTRGNAGIFLWRNSARVAGRLGLIFVHPDDESIVDVLPHCMLCV